MINRKTHFEQIPVEVVKEIVEKTPAKPAAIADDDPQITTSPRGGKKT